MFLRSTPTPPAFAANNDEKSLRNALPDLKSTARGVEPPAHDIASRSPPRARPSTSNERSVIGPDLRIAGSGLRIMTAGILEIDGQIEGDVQGAQIIVGERGSITGTVAADHVLVKGTVNGEIRGREVVLDASSHVDGDVHHHHLTITQGAHFEGRSRRTNSTEPVALDAAE
jgi:cytoskeletal protein CcmA (bactofilin family)